MASTVTVIAIFEPRTDRIEEFVALMEPMIRGSNSEPGCLMYDLYEDEADDGLYILIEQYSDREALQAHRDSAHFAAYRSESGDVLKAPVEVRVLRPARLAAG